MSGRFVNGALLAALLAAGAVPVPAIGQQGAGDVPVVTLDEARRRGNAVDPVSVAASAEVGVATWGRRTATADLFTPRIEAAGSYAHYSLPFFNFATLAESPNATSATLRASYSLLGAGKVGELRRARAALASAEASETATRFRTALATDATYFAVLADRELSRVAAERLRRAEEQFAIARVRVLAGEAISSDSLQLLLEVNRARLGVLRRDSALAVSRLRLGRRIGLAGPADAAPVDTALAPSLPLTADEAVREMRARGPELEAARAAERQANATLLAEREGYLPSITLGAERTAYDVELFPSAKSITALTVGVSVPFWDGGRRELDVARAGAARSVARAEREDLERAAAAEMTEAYQGYATARAATELAAVGVSVAAESYRVQRARYREGATTILDLLEAQVALGEAEAELVQSRYATRLALARIEALLGRRLLETPTTEQTDR